MAEYDPFNPATYLDPGDLAMVDQWEAEARIHSEECVQMMRDIEEEGGPQSLVTWYALIEEYVEPDRMAIILAYLLIKEARRAPEEAQEGSNPFTS